ncbi:bicaudal D protein [Sarcoptes scabiei]|nr:bicaudal D protein [Sarcoptes scabiei]
MFQYFLLKLFEKNGNRMIVLCNTQPPPSPPLLLLLLLLLLRIKMLLVSQQIVKSNLNFFFSLFFSTKLIVIDIHLCLFSVFLDIIFLKLISFQNITAKIIEALRNYFALFLLSPQNSLLIVIYSLQLIVNLFHSSIAITLLFFLSNYNYHCKEIKFEFFLI